MTTPTLETGAPLLLFGGKGLGVYHVHIKTTILETFQLATLREKMTC